ncbi:hypothetical protein ABI023_13795, partial [Enterococcus faecium]
VIPPAIFFYYSTLFDSRFKTLQQNPPKYCANIVDTQLKNNEVILSGEIPARCIQEYRSDLTFFTNGRSVCLTELKGYHVTTGEPVCQPRRPNSRIDKVRYMFNKIT